MADVKDTLRSYIQTQFMYDKPDRKLDEDTPLVNEGIVDSLGIFMLISFIDEELGVKIEPEDVVIENFETLDAITNLVKMRSN